MVIKPIDAWRGGVWMAYNPSNVHVDQLQGLVMLHKIIV